MPTGTNPNSKMNVVDSVFKLPLAVEANGTITKVLETQDTYLDKNIKIEITTPDATFEVKDKGEGASGEITATVSTTDTTYTSDTETPYAITIAADAHVNAITVGTAQAGFTAASDETTLAAGDATQATKTIYVKEGALSGTGSAGATGNVGLTKVAAQPESGFYIKASGAGNVGVATAGWVDPDKTTAVTTDGDAYYTVKTASLANTGNEASTELTTPVLTSGGYLYIKEGYIGDTKISLANLIPDDATIAETEAGKSEFMYKTISAYDKDGKLIAGSMDDATFSAISGTDASATINTVAVNPTETGFAVTGTANIAGSASATVATTGYAVKDTEINGTVEGTAKVNASIAKIALGVNVNEADKDVEVTPVIAKEDATTAKSGDISTTAPTSGHYVAVSTAAIEKEVGVNAKVNSEGYGSTSIYSATGETIKAGSAASGTYYVAIDDGGHSITENASEVTPATAVVSTAVAASDARAIGGVLAAAPTSGAYLTIDGTTDVTDGSVKTSSTCTVTEGYVTAESKTTTITEAVSVTPTAAATKYIKIYEGAILDA